jgi:hypothetical protein
MPTQQPIFQQLLFGAGLMAAVTFMLSVSRAREGIRHKLYRMFVALTVYCIAVIVMTQVQHAAMPVAMTVGILAGLVADLFVPARSRHIPTGTRRAIVSDWERKHGRKFSAREYELDHDVPFSRGGSSTRDNLRVRSRRYNRAKGARRPWWYWG